MHTKLAASKSPLLGTVSFENFSFRKFLWVWLTISVPWVALWYALQDMQAWPLNDDPFYAKPLALWVSTGRWQWVHQYGELTASSILHTATGALVLVGHEFSYRTLFLACIFQQSLGAAALYGTARVLGATRRFSWVVGASLAMFPLFFGHAFTFMTDGPATGWSALACACGVIGMVRWDWRWLCACSLAVGCGYWVRQTNGLLLLAPVVAVGLTRVPMGQQKSEHQHAAKHALAVVGLAGVAVLLLESGWFTPSSGHRVKDVFPSFDADYVKRISIAGFGWLLLSGWYLLPWLVAFVQEARRAMACEASPIWRRCTIAAAVVFILGLLPFAMTGGRACLTNSTGAFIQNAHYGPIFLSDMDEPGRWAVLDGVEWPLWIWKALSLLSLLACAAAAWWAAWSVLTWIDQSRQGSADPRMTSAVAWLAMIGAAVLVVLFLVEPHMDRYWLFIMPALSVWWISVAVQRGVQLSKLACAWAAIWIAVNGVMSVVFTHDMLAWNDARWRYVNSCLATSMPAEDLDAGRDVNAWLRMDEDPETSAREGDTSPWWSGRATHALAVGERPGWRIVQRLPWNAWATLRTHYLLVLDRDDSHQAFP